MHSPTRKLNLEKYVWLFILESTPMPDGTTWTLWLRNWRILSEICHMLSICLCPWLRSYIFLLMLPISPSLVQPKCWPQTPLLWCVLIFLDMSLSYVFCFILVKAIGLPIGIPVCKQFELHAVDLWLKEKLERTECIDSKKKKKNARD